MDNKTINFFGTKVSACTVKTQLEKVSTLVTDRSYAHYITYTNTHVVVLAKHNKQLKIALKNADICSPDGMPLVIIGKLRGNIIQKCSGPDMIHRFFEISEKVGYSNFFYGSTEKTLSAMCDILKTKYPKLRIVGTYSPPFRILTEEEDREIVDRINAVSPDFIWVGLGAPKQEVWMYEHRDCIKRGVMFGVGAAFDFIAGNVERAPKCMQSCGLEWLYRLYKEPKRLWKRYLITNILFFVYLLSDCIKEIFRSDSSASG